MEFTGFGDVFSNLASFGCSGSAVPVARARVQLAAGRVPASIRKLDASSKWLVTAGQTAAVVIRHDILSPYIVLGGIAASLFTAKIKRIVNQRRPPGSPLTDPGMPSSHALVATFMSVAWATQVQPELLLLTIVPACHSVAVAHQIPPYGNEFGQAQVGVGATAGTLLSVAWMLLGQDIIRSPTSLETKVVYALYIIFSALFLAKQFRKGRSRKKEEAMSPSMS
ncbi:LPPE1 [Symbiodinium sp. CCMP2456]|nr:LPPE1 [Symbiodinium sp. CCMP2456]